MAVGPGDRDKTGKLIPIDVKVGDRVLFESGRAPRSR
jgi:chaperonin GroES